MAHTALVTGASSGFGAELAKLFARERHDVVLVARRRDRLEALAAELEKAHGVRAHVIAVDLASDDGTGALLAEVKRLGLSIDFLVNSAGFGTHGAFAELDPAREVELLRVNVTALVALTRALVPEMIARGHGRVLNFG